MSEQKVSIKVTPAPGYVLVVQKRSSGEGLDGIPVAARENPMHEGTVRAIGFTPKIFRWGLRRGHVITFARFNAVNVSGAEEGYLAVPMQHIVCKKEDVAAYSALSFWQKAKGWFNFSIIGGAFAAGYFAHDAYAWLRKTFKK